MSQETPVFHMGGAIDINKLAANERHMITIGRHVTLDSKTTTQERDRGRYMHVFSGAKYFPMDPEPRDVDIRDIAHSLATKARYAGHTIYPFWVGQHSRYTALYRVPGFNRPEHRLARLLHDASEAYNGDLIRPLKYDPEFRAPFSKVEERNERVISERFGLPFPFEGHIKVADEAVTSAEVEQLINKRDDMDFSGKLHDDSKVADFKFREEHWQKTEERFLRLFSRLVADRYENNPDNYWDGDEYQRSLELTCI